MPKNESLKKILVLGSGAIKIGEALITLEVNASKQYMKMD